MSENVNAGTAIEAEKRRAARVAVRIPVQFSVIIPEETFSPTMTEATILNLSESGVLVEAVLALETYNSLLQKVRYCRLDIDQPEELACRVIGRAVWIKPRVQGALTVCQIGLYFENAPDGITAKFQKYVDQMLAGARRQS